MHRSWPAFRHRFGWKLAIAIAITALGDVLLFQQAIPAIAIGLFALALIAALIGGRSGARQDRRAWIAAFCASVFGTALMIDPGLLAWALFWIALGMATLLPATSAFDDGWRWFQRLLLHGLRAPVGPLLDLLRLRRLARRRSTRRAAWRAALPVLALPFIGSIVILLLFAAANPVIGDLLSRIRLPAPSAISIFRALLWLIVFTMIWSILRPRLFTRLIPTFDGSGDLPLPGVSVASVRLSLILFNLLFAVQNLLDAAYLWSFAPLPAGITLADYAHRGAYPLIATALLAALFVLVTLRPGSQTAAIPAIRRLVLLWIGQNVFLVASSILRTMDYVAAYSLTMLRIAALAWMLLVAIGLMLICWRMIRGRSAGWLINANLIAAGAVLTTACFVDTGAVAAAWNVRHAREAGGTGAALDLCYLDQLGHSSLLSLIQLERRPLDRAFRIRVQVVRERLKDRIDLEHVDNSLSWRDTRRRKMATALLAGIRPIPVPPGDRDCHGALIPPPPVQPQPKAPPPLPSAPAIAPAPPIPTQPRPHPLTGSEAR